MAPKSKSIADAMSPEALEQALYVPPPSDPQVLEEHVRQLLMRAQVSWLSKRDVLDILTNWREYSLPISLMPPDQPGRALSPYRTPCFRRVVRVQRVGPFRTRTQLKSFRRDNHVWKSKAGGKTVQETHEKLKIDGGIPALNCYYAHSADGTLQRRCYWKLAGNRNIVLMHYRSPGSIKGRAVNAATPLHLQDRSGAGDATAAAVAGAAQASEAADVGGVGDGNLYPANPAPAVDDVAYHPDPSIAVPSPDGAAHATEAAVDTSVPAPAAGSMVVPAPPAIVEPAGNSIPAAHSWDYNNSRDWYHASMNPVQHTAWQSALPSDVIHPASQPPASEQLVMHQPYLDPAQNQAVEQHHEVTDDGAVGLQTMPTVSDDQHVPQTGIAPPAQPDLYRHAEDDFRNMDPAGGATLNPAVKAEAPLEPHVAVEASTDSDNMHAGVKRHHATHAAHVEPALNMDAAAPGPGLEDMQPDCKRARTHEELLQ